MDSNSTENEQMVDGGGSSGGSIVPLEHTQPNAADPKKDIVDDGLRDVKSEPQLHNTQADELEEIPNQPESSQYDPMVLAQLIELLQKQQQQLLLSTESPKVSRKRAEYPCGFCEKVFSCYSHMKKHEIVHSDERPFKCDYCDKLFRRKYDCSRHMKVVHIQRMMKRKLEPTVEPGPSSSSSELVPQIEPPSKKKEKPKDGYDCETCGKSFSCPSHLKRHTIMHTDEKPFTCDFCPKEFRRKYDRNRHVKYVHLKSVDDAGQLMITDGSAAAADSDLGQLVENKSLLLPQMEQYFKCDYCDSKFKRIYDRTRHIKMAHHAIISPSLETLKIIPETGDDDEEIDVVEDSAPTPTEVDFKSESDVSDSVVVMAEEAPVEAISLEANSPSADSPSADSPSTSALPYQCWACDKRFSCHSQMKNHEVVHSDEKPFICEVCNRGFRRKYDMKRHVQLIHKMQATEESRIYTTRQANSDHNQTMFDCTVCQKQFTCLSHLRNHEVVHSEERPFKCSFCDKAFRRKYDKNRHVALVHGAIDPSAADDEQLALPASSTDDLSNFRATLLQMILMANKSDSENKGPQQMPKTEPELPEQIC